MMKMRICQIQATRNTGKKVQRETKEDSSGIIVTLLVSKTVTEQGSIRLARGVRSIKYVPSASLHENEPNENLLLKLE